MKSGNQTSDIDSDGDQNIASFTKLSLHPPIDTDKENERKKLAKLLKRYTENKEELIRNAKDLHKVSSILRRERRQTICFEEYSKLAEQQNICTIIEKQNYINILLPEGINTMKKLSKYSIEELKRLRIEINSNCENEHENIEEFLLSFGSTQIKDFMFYGKSIEIKNENYDSDSGDEYSVYLKVFQCSGYFYCLRDVMSKATNSIRILDTLLSSKEFSTILRAAKHVKQLYFINCKILTDAEHELGQMEGCQIELLRFGYYTHVFKKLRDYEDSCMKIFLSIVGCTNLLTSLKCLKINCGREIKKKLLSKAKEILGYYYDMLMPSLEHY